MISIEYSHAHRHHHQLSCIRARDPDVQLISLITSATFYTRVQTPKSKEMFETNENSEPSENTEIDIPCMVKLLKQTNKAKIMKIMNLGKMAKLVNSYCIAG